MGQTRRAIVHPAARQAATFRASIDIGKFQGVMLRNEREREGVASAIF